MKSLNDRYVETQSSVHETFADLIFCALVVLVLFVMMLAVEVSQRVRAKVPEIPEVQVAENVERMTPEEIERLSQRLKMQQEELNSLRTQIVKQTAALSGEQRFTGAREPASLSMAYDLQTRRFYLVPSKDVEHADRSQSGESTLEFFVRKSTELRLIAARARRSQRGYTMDEAKKLYTAFSQYQQINPTESSYTVSMEKLGINYHTQLCAFIAGGDTVSDHEEERIVDAILEVYDHTGPSQKKMYPVLEVQIDSRGRTANINGVTLQPLQLRNLLLALSGRGAMIDLTGLEGRPPDWLTEQVLTPAGYIGNVPKMP